MEDKIACDSCSQLVNKPDPGTTVDCVCGQSMFNNPNGRFGPYIGGIYKHCAMCRRLIKGVVSFSQHYHDECYLEMEKVGHFWTVPTDN